MTKIQLGYDYEKLKSSLRHWMLGRNYFTACKAMDFGLFYHTGIRKDGLPEFSHQVFQANYARTLSNVINPEGLLITIFCHDTVEDIAEVTQDDIRQRFGDANSQSVWCMTNQYPDGTKKTKEMYYGEMAYDVNASLAKGIDRIHNHQSMSGAFTREKQLSYIGETREYILPMLKTARKEFPEQEAAYQNISHVLLTQMELIGLMHTQTS